VIARNKQVDHRRRRARQPVRREPICRSARGAHPGSLADGLDEVAAQHRRRSGRSRRASSVGRAVLAATRAMPRVALHRRGPTALDVLPRSPTLKRWSSDLRGRLAGLAALAAERR
jgi:hypothetical protein